MYASYLGQAWHQLWLIPAQGGDAFPISYGAYDNINPRWSPDGKHIAFISNRDGNTSLWIEDIPGGAQRQLAILQRHYLKPTAMLDITVVDENGKPTPARISILDDDGRAYAPDEAWMQADDSLDPAQRKFEVHYFDTDGHSRVTVPAGQITVEVIKGFEYSVEQRKLPVSGENANLVVQLRPLVSADGSLAFASTSDSPTLAQRGFARPHGLRRRLPQYTPAPGVTRGGRKSGNHRRLDCE